MAVIGTPVSARARFTYLDTNLQTLSINGINPLVNANQLSQFVTSLSFIQAAPVHNGFVTREVDLEEN